MFTQKADQKRSALATLLILVGGLTLVLGACGGRPSIKGKWEQISGEILWYSIFGYAGPGTLWEFFDDGTVSIGVMLGNVSGKYSWPDSSHLKIEMSQGSGIVSSGIVYEFSRSGDEIVLKDPSTQSVITLRRYEELSLSPQSLAGVWEKDIPDESRCFVALGIESAPAQIEFKTDGTFSVQQEGGFLIGDGISLYGQFLVKGDNLQISATGTRTDVGLWGETQEQIGGEINCQVTVSHSRLLFKDADGKVTLYVRTQK